MDTIATVGDLRARVRGWRSAAARVSLVPTMGNLHAGHLALIREARCVAERVVASIFVNPLQFGADEDLANYPRTLAEDRRRLEQAGTDLLFAPPVEEVYPDGQDRHTRVEVPDLSDVLCGVNRPGHFVGVATVVCKLLNMVQPDLAVFGEKDYQQLLVIRRMTRDLCLPVEILGVPTVREADGLAMSSRNGYLEAQQRRRAPVLFRTLQRAAQRLLGGAPVAAVEREGMRELERAGFRPDYFSVRRATDLAPPAHDDRQLAILAAARLGRTRLIDNLRVRR